MLFVLIITRHVFHVIYSFCCGCTLVSYCYWIFSQGHKPPALWSEGRCIQFFHSTMGTSNSKGIVEIGIIVLYSLIYLPFQFLELNDNFFPSGTLGTVWYHDSTASCFRCETGLFFIYQWDLPSMHKIEISISCCCKAEWQHRIKFYACLLYKHHHKPVWVAVFNQ